MVSTIADLREQTLLVVALLDQADKALEERNAATFCEFFCKGHEAARSARERARALHDQVCSHTRRNVTRGGAR